MSPRFSRPIPLRNETSFANRDAEHMAAELGYSLGLYPIHTETAEDPHPQVVLEAQVDPDATTGLTKERPRKLFEYLSAGPLNATVISPAATSPHNLNPGANNEYYRTIYNIDTTARTQRSTPSPAALVEKMYGQGSHQAVPKKLAIARIGLPVPLIRTLHLQPHTSDSAKGFLANDPFTAPQVSMQLEALKTACEANTTALTALPSTSTLRIATVSSTRRARNRAMKRSSRIEDMSNDGIFFGRTFTCAWGMCAMSITLEGRTDDAFQAAVRSHIREHTANCASTRGYRKADLDTERTVCLWDAGCGETVVNDKRTIRRHIWKHVDATRFCQWYGRKT
ncbi:hypothetical protein H0H81_010220 [Sphagnurus paluster]|uniref:Uncharacterized protein n=1 Tax=Sphagnurus paluster TaxID=117069 RepID=A0A9P7FPF3_9AGAR|nr:hypothetical protein H0H81_010220 [Sphagnurus paluster]